MCIVCVPGTPRGLKRALDPLRLGLTASWEPPCECWGLKLEMFFTWAVSPDHCVIVSLNVDLSCLHRIKKKDEIICVRSVYRGPSTKISSLRHFVVKNIDYRETCTKDSRMWYRMLWCSQKPMESKAGMVYHSFLTFLPRVSCIPGWPWTWTYSLFSCLHILNAEL